MPRVSEQVEWLSLVDISGPFLAASVLERVFPQGLEKVETPRRQRLRSAYEEWRDAVDDEDTQLREMHSAWVLMVLQDMLEYEDAVLVSRQALDGKCIYRAPEHGVEAMPDYAVRRDDGKCCMLVSVWPPETDLEKVVSGDPWPASPLERMTLLCRANEVRLGLVTDGERWMVVNAPVGATSGYAAWLARLWWQEPVTLKAFQSLLGVRRCFGPKEDTLDALLERSTEFQEEVTDTLGEQVRRAVEILVQSLGRADQDRNGELLKDVGPAELYEAGLTVMMRLVFTLCAEERGLLLLGDPTYDQYYAISTLRSLLREDADRFGVEVLERRHDAWSRLLAVFRAIYGGVEHESLRVPALGGSLFDPDRFPFLEGRAKGTTWRETRSVPLPIDNRTVLLLLDALQVLEQRSGAQLLSYRALDVEQIGHVYEGLLEYTVAKLDKVTVGLIGSQKVRHPSITLVELETLKVHGREKAAEQLVDLTGRSAAAVRNALIREGDEAALLRLVHGCGGDETLARRLLPFVDLIRADSWGTMLVYRPGSFAVVHGSDRRETGTHYTPRSLTESIVEKTLKPIVYAGPAEGEPRERWKLKTPAELLDLKICDPAMGSGAFLVQVCRYLAERLVEAYAHEESKGKAITVDGIVLDALGDGEPMPKSLDERLIIARRLIAERCLYGVDINPLAVELAKLSIWLVTMAKGRPFGFLDHNLRSGDSLLGIHRLDQLTKLAMNPDEPNHPQRLFGQNIGKCINEAVAIRSRLGAIPIRDILDVEAMARLDSEARKRLEAVELVADAMIGAALAKSGQPRAISSVLDSLAVEAGEYLGGNAGAGTRIARDAYSNLSLELPEGKAPRNPLHWAIEFPEVFAAGSFDGIVSNPPFMGGKKITGAFGTNYRDYCLAFLADGRKGNADLCAYFFLRILQILRHRGMAGLLATNTIAQGETREVGLDYIVSHGSTIVQAVSSAPWPGTASLEIAHVWIWNGKWSGTVELDGIPVSQVTSYLTPALCTGGTAGAPHVLTQNHNLGFQGTIVLGMGFVLEPDAAKKMLTSDPRNGKILSPYLNGEDLMDRHDLSPSRWVINFGAMPLAEAETYVECMGRVRAQVKPERDLLKDKGYREKWWQFGRRAVDLYNAIQQLDRVIAMCKVAKYLIAVFVPSHFVYSNRLTVFAMRGTENLALLQSTIHETWARRYSATLETRLSYTPTDCFETFPFPETMDALAGIGDMYDASRCSVLRERQEGLTKVYNRLHDINEKSEDIVRLRALHREMDQTVAAAYGWSDLDLGHGFHETKQGIRYTISETARRTVLDRLLTLNHQRYEEEVKAGLHDRRKHASSVMKGSVRESRRGHKQKAQWFEGDER